jgi:hypothetical protein
MLTLPLTLALALQASYEMADLKALEKQGGFKELVAHLNDIPPSKRDKDWEGIAERAAAGWLGTIDVKDEYTAQEALGVADEILTHYTFLKQSKVYMGKRAEVALKAFKWTYSQSRHSAGDDPWRDELKKFAESDTVTPDLPARMAKELIIGRLIPETAFPLFKMAWDRGNKGLCKDKDFQKMLVEVVGDGAWKDQSAEMRDKCWDDLKAPLTAQLKKEGTSSFARNACPVFKAKGGVPADGKAACDGLIQ